MGPKTNRHAVEAAARKEEKESKAKAQKAKEEEDAKWVETDPKALKALEKEKERQQKLQEEEKKRKEKAELLRKEEEALHSKKKQDEPPVKYTQFAMNATFEKEQKEREREKQEREREKQRIAEQEFVLENVNHMKIEGDEARTVDEAINVLNNNNSNNNAEDAHPERRMKAAHKAYEEKMMPILKAENPSLKFTQLKELCWQNWLKAPENPHNQLASSSSSSSSSSRK